jgi:hypothetical protein
MLIMNPFRYFKQSQRKRIYRHSNYLQSKDSEWVSRNSQKPSRYDADDESLDTEIED